jgi:hypothetical protein
MHQLRLSLKENLNQLGEASVLNIITAYSYLPRDFNYDLLDEIKIMVMITLQHNPANLKSSFLLEFMERCAQLPRNRGLVSERVTTL